MQLTEQVAKGAVSVILALSLITARADLLWTGNSRLLGYSAGQIKRKQTVWLRRIMLLEVGKSTIFKLLWTAALLLTSKSCVGNQVVIKPH